MTGNDCEDFWLLVGFEPQFSAIFLNIIIVSIICLLVPTDCGDKPRHLKKNKKNHSILNTHGP